MAEEEKKSEDESPKKRFPVKMIIVIAAVMVVEAVLIFGGVKLLGPDPAPATAEGLKVDEEAEAMQEIEVLLIGDKFQNTRHGAQAYLYDATIYVVVQRRHQEHVEQMIEKNIARISQEVTEVFARAEPAQLNEPNRLTLKRQILEKCQKRFGRVYDKMPDKSDGDQEDYGQYDEDYYVRDVVISNWKRFSADL